MLTFLWLKGLLAQRAGRLLGTSLGVALTVSLLASLGTFIASRTALMTQRAIASVPVDWQMQLSAGTDVSTAQKALGQSTAYTALEQVNYASINGFTAQTGNTVQTTGAGEVVGISPLFHHTFPHQVRLLTGSLDGVVIMQQTAANLHVTTGDTVTIQREGLPPIFVRIAGVVDLPNADSFFQAVGVPTNAAPQAPPDNVILLPLDQWHPFFDAQATMRPDSVHVQLHVNIAHNLPTNPDNAFTFVQQKANNVKVRLAGGVLIGNNLAARLSAVRQDALYVEVLFLFLGLPGVVLAILLTLAVASAGMIRRRQEQALLRTRGASSGQVLGLEAIEGLVVGIGGVILGIGLAFIWTTLMAPFPVLSMSTTISWIVIAAFVGLLLALIAILFPAWRQARSTTVADARSVVRHIGQPLWQRLYLDVITLIVSATMFWRTASTGYQVVLAPEGVPGSSVAYETFLAPLCLWIGISLLAVRLCSVGLAHGRRVLASGLSPFAGKLSGVVSASLSRQRVLITRGVVLVALAFSFAVSTAIFNTTYNAQSQVDAQLTNGADVTVTGPTASAPSTKLQTLRALPDIASAQPMQHRFAYVGNDLQDLYGIDPLHISKATPMSNAFFVGGNAQATLSTLASHPDGILVSEETVMNYQLQVGDPIKLRIQNAQDHQYHTVPFHYIGVVREFPTAPKDSFLVVNSKYLTLQSGTNAAEIVLMRTTGNPVEVARHARTVVRSLAGVQVTDIHSAQRLISSSLMSVNLHGLTSLELVFAVLLVAGAMGLVLALGLRERRRTFALLTALGAKSPQLAAFLWSEGLLIQIAGGIVGIPLGFGVAQMLVTILTGVFDPPPDLLTVPWVYLILLTIAAIASIIVAIVSACIASQRAVVETLRNF